MTTTHIGHFVLDPDTLVALRWERGSDSTTTYVGLHNGLTGEELGCGVTDEELRAIDGAMVVAGLATGRAAEVPAGASGLSTINVDNEDVAMVFAGGEVGPDGLVRFTLVRKSTDETMVVTMPPVVCIMAGRLLRGAIGA